MKAKKRLGEMLIEAGLLTDDRLRQALVDARRTKLKLGQFLVRNGILNEGQIVDTVAQQLKVDKYQPSLYPVDVGLARLIPPDLAQKHQVVPLRKKGSLLVVAMPDPMDLGALDMVEANTNCEAEPVICTEQQFNGLFSALYGKFSNYGGVLEDMEEMKIDSKEEVVEGPVEDLNVSSLQGMAEEAPVIRLVNSILAQAVRENASDIHFSPEKDHVSVRFRVDGRLQEVPSPPRTMFLPMISRLKILSNLDIAVSRIPQDGRFTVKMGHSEINIRVSTLPTIYGENAVLRLLNMSAGVYSLDRLGMSATEMKKIEPMIVKPYGMILSTGPTGSGKSTSLYAILKEINQPDINIITLEDPVEYRVDGIRQVQLNRRAGMTFASGLRSILRQDPDVIMVGEIRDSETATIAVQAALTGHRLLSTVHTNDAAGAITRLIDMGIEPFLVASVLLVSFAQRLVRRVCQDCKEAYQPPRQALEYFGISPSENLTFYRGKGCYNCMDTGYRGRTGIFEVLVVDETVQEMTLRRASSAEITRAAKRAGKLITLKDDAAEKIRKGITTVEEAISTVMT
ncbi:MAG: ATPase, T2SS/T4P/T4SS family [Thermodesulfobacteriota bacterium]